MATDSEKLAALVEGLKAVLDAVEGKPADPPEADGDWVEPPAGVLIRPEGVVFAPLETYVQNVPGHDDYFGIGRPPGHPSRDKWEIEGLLHDEYYDPVPYAAVITWVWHGGFVRDNPGQWVNLTVYDRDGQVAGYVWKARRDRPRNIKREIAESEDPHQMGEEEVSFVDRGMAHAMIGKIVGWEPHDAEGNGIWFHPLQEAVE